MSLRSRLIVQCTGALVAAAAMLFVPAGTLRFWEAWVFLGIFFVPLAVFCVYYYEHDPRMVERRLQSKEKFIEQRVVMKVANMVCVVALLIPGLDHRFGWTRELAGGAGGVPLWVRIAAQAVVLAGYLMTMWVIDVNRFASRTIQVEAGQKVVSGGPYGMVRHPMYFAALVMWLSVAPALGSYVALPFFALLIPVIVARLMNEEKVLRQELPGYVEYCQKTRFRLVPYIW